MVSYFCWQQEARAILERLGIAPAMPPDKAAIPDGLTGR
jgi:hypothetical protein